MTSNTPMMVWRATPQWKIYHLSPDFPIPRGDDFLSQDDRSRLMTIKHAEKKRSFLRGRYLLSAIGGIKMLQRTSHGYLYSSPQVSLSHKHGWVICGVLNPDYQGQQTPATTNIIFGLDLEKQIISQKLADKLQQKYGSSHVTCVDMARPFLGTILFSAQEAIYKGFARYGLQSLMKSCVLTQINDSLHPYFDFESVFESKMPIQQFGSCCDFKVNHKMVLFGDYELILSLISMAPFI
ncbi:MAG: hypothetical protein OXC40_06920 [Proteobacteria bacterium]|nr:hypothetical protein [Pseudomonadota bacterium]